MRKGTKKRVFAVNEAADLVGRKTELESLITHALGSETSKGLVALAAPSAGLSELLRQVYDRLFFEQQEVVPFYFEFRASDKTARAAASRFVREFLLQTVAFRRRDASI